MQERRLAEHAHVRNREEHDISAYATTCRRRHHGPVRRARTNPVARTILIERGKDSASGDRVRAHGAYASPSGALGFGGVVPASDST